MLKKTKKKTKTKEKIYNFAYEMRKFAGIIKCEPGEDAVSLLRKMR